MAQVDSRIALGVQAPQFENRLAQLAQMEQMQAYRQRGELQGLQMQQLQQEQADNALMRQIMAESGGDLEAASKSALSRGLTNPGLDLQKRVAEGKTAALTTRKVEGDIAKQGTEAEKAKLEAAMQQFSVIGQIMGPVRDQASYDLARQQAASVLGEDAAAKIPPQYDPAAIERNRQQAMTMQQQIEARYKALTFDQGERKFGETQRHNRSTEGTAQGTLAARQQEVAMGGKPPPGYAWAAPGQLAAIPGGPGDDRTKAMTGDQANAGTFAARMADAEGVLGRMKTRGVDQPSMVKRAADAVPLVGTGLGMLANATVVSPEQQMVEQAELNWVSANLRKESGAAIPVEELANERRKYFPQPGEGPEVIEQKRKARAVAANGMLQAVPEGRRASYGLPGQGTPGASADNDPLGIRGAM